jgi:transcriptional regulator with XRE-family HTH domain
MQLSEDRRSEIASFLRQRRARLRPADVGLPAGRRRRTPGLRREEVAALAGVSTEWYKWLEQARAVRPSMETLRRISDALRCEPGETRHLLMLAGYGEPHATPPSNGAVHDVGDHIARLIAQLDPCPAWVHGERWDFLAWNRAATIIHGDLAALRGIERNGMYQFFLGDRMRRTLVDWERHARGLVGTLRIARGRYVDDAWFDELIGTLLERSPKFAELWADHHVRPFQDGRKDYEHPEAGRLSFEYTILRVADERLPVMNLVTYIPIASTPTRAQLESLIASSP